MKSNHSKTYINCPVCGASDLTPIMDIPGVPVYCNRLWSSRKEAVGADRGDILLSFCNECGHVFNLAFNPGLMAYTEDYENSLHFSLRFQKYATTLAENLVKKYSLYDKDVVEIGCGKGDFLSMICRLGRNRGVGFDPSFEEDREDVGDQRFQVIKDLYSEKYAGFRADIVCCRHVLEHIQEPNLFLQSIYKTVMGQNDPVLFFEVPNVMFTLKDMGIWDLIYEHCGYFSRSSLAFTFEAAGFQTFDIYESFGSQFLCIEAGVKGKDNRTKSFDRNDVGRMKDYVKKFSDEYDKKIKTWQTWLKNMKKKHRVVIWGAGSKGITFLNVLKIEDQIKYVVDINPHKQGKYAPGTGQEIVSPQYLEEYCPDMVILMNPLYLEEVGNIISDLGFSSSIITV